MLKDILHTKNGNVKGIFKNSYKLLMTLRPAQDNALSLPHPPKLNPCSGRGYGVGVASGVADSTIGVGEEAESVVSGEKEQIVRTTAISAAMFGSAIYSEASMIDAISNACGQ